MEDRLETAGFVQQAAQSLFRHPRHLFVGDLFARVPIGGNTALDVLPDVVLVLFERDVAIYLIEGSRYIVESFGLPLATEAAGASSAGTVEVPPCLFSWSWRIASLILRIVSLSSLFPAACSSSACRSALATKVSSSALLKVLNGTSSGGFGVSWVGAGEL